MPFPAALSPEQQKDVARLYKTGLSALQVAQHFDVSLDATYYALRRLKIQRRTPQETNRIRFEAKPLSYHVKLKLSKDEENLKLAAIMLYWAEGYKVGKSTVDFANSDPDMILIFWKFLSKICRVDRQRVGLHLYCYEGQDVQNLMKYWSDLLKLPTSHFTKPYVKKATAPGPRGPRMTHGLVHIRYCDKKLLRQVLKWIEEYAQKCVGGRVVNCTAL